jgi:signal transduction histidine kinase
MTGIYAKASDAESSDGPWPLQPELSIVTPITDERFGACGITPPNQVEQELRFLYQVCAALGASLEHSETIASVARLAVPMLADLCVIDLLDGEGNLRRAKVELRPGTPWQALGTKVSMSGSGSTVLDAATSLVCLPLQLGERRLGVLRLAMLDSARTHQSSDLELAWQFAQRAAVAIEHATLYRDARRAVHARDELLAIVAHDLRAPLGCITLATSTLLDVPDSSDRRNGRKQLEAIRRGAMRMKRLIGDLVDLSSLELGQLSMHPSEHRLGDMLASVTEMLGPIAHEKQLQFEVESGSAGCRVLCDRERVLQVFFNVLDNAMKFTPAGGRVTLRARLAKDAVEFAVSDTGPGIPPAILPRVFDRHVHADKAAHGGSGLGLYIARRIVTAHGGMLWAHSEVGAGSTFSFTLPLQRDRTKPQTENAPPLSKTD